VLFDITDASKEKWDPHRMKSAGEDMSKKEMGIYKAYRFSACHKQQQIVIHLMECNPLCFWNVQKQTV